MSGGTLLDLAVILLLVMLNAVFVAAEIALVSIRPSRVEQLVDEGRGGARRVRRLTADPGRFLAVIQLAITFIGFLASAFAGVSLAASLADLLVAAGLGRGPASAIGLLVVTILLSLFTIVFGELVPKSLALAHPEAFALRLSAPVDLLGRAFRPLVAMLTAATRAISGALGTKVNAEAQITVD